MASPPDFMKMMQDAAAAFRFDPAGLQEAMRNSAGQAQKLSSVALGAAGESAELSAKLAREMLARLGEVTRAKDSPAEYSQAMADFAKAQADMVGGQLSAFAAIAQKVQAETAEVLAAAAESVSAEAGEAVRKAAEGLNAFDPRSRK